jgi:glycosyltransferase involved in cell wall biosynthesis
MKSVVYVFQDHYPWDVRAEKITRSLAEAGYPTVLVSRNRTGAIRDEELGRNLHVRRLPRGWGGLTRTALNFPAFFSPVWIGEIVRTVRARHAGVIIVRDLPLGPAAYFAARLTGVPVVMDMAENYPAMIADTWRFRGRGPFDPLLRNPRLLRRLEKWTLPRMDCVIAVSEESAERVRGIVAARGTPVRVVGNTPLLGVEKDPPTSELSARMREMHGLRLLYVGGLEESRGLDVPIRALAAIRSRIGEVHLVVVGDGTSRPALEKLAAAHGVSDCVHLAGWLQPEYVPGVIAESDICLVPHYVTEHIATTIPNKIYDYMLQAKPVLVTQSPSLRAIIEKSGCGLWYNDQDPQALAQAACEIADPARRAELGENGRRSVLSEFNWLHDEKVLLGTVASIGKA